jgi:DNA (cytosine-5)-methyltransferase 1
MSTLLSISDAASQLHVSIDTIRRWHKKGLIKAVRDARQNRLFDRAELERARAKYSGGAESHPFKVLKTRARHGLTSVELFAGAGGLALGLENAGFKHRLLVEIDKDAAATLSANRPDWQVECRDAREVSYKGVSADVVLGGFPCQAFSYAGNQLGFDDVRGTLFFELARCIKEVRPRVAVGENVRGLLQHDDGRTLRTMIGVLRELGYRVCTRLLRAQYLDVPQKRERLIVMAVREDIDAPFIFPRERDYTVSLREALKDVPQSSGQAYPEKKRRIMELVPQGGYWRDLPIKLQKEYMGGSFHLPGGKTGMARRLAWDEPSLTLTCAPAQKQTERCHPEETRPLTVREYARIQTFPDDWRFSGSTSSSYKQIGNAVPVNLGYHLGMSIAAMLGGKYDPKGMVQVDEKQCETLRGVEPTLFDLVGT